MKPSASSQLIDLEQELQRAEMKIYKLFGTAKLDTGGLLTGNIKEVRRKLRKLAEALKAAQLVASDPDPLP